MCGYIIRLVSLRCFLSRFWIVGDWAFVFAFIGGRIVGVIFLVFLRIGGLGFFLGLL